MKTSHWRKSDSNELTFLLNKFNAFFGKIPFLNEHLNDNFKNVITQRYALSIFDLKEIFYHSRLFVNLLTKC